MNAPQELFLSHMKDSLDYKKCTTFDELKFIIDDYIDYYNNDRCGWNLKRLTPIQYRNQLLTQQSLFSYFNILIVNFRPLSH